MPKEFSTLDNSDKTSIIQKENLITFINCNEEMACGMRMLAAMAKDTGFRVHIIVLRGYHVTRQDKLDELSTSMHVCVNGRFHTNSDKSKPFNANELLLMRRKLLDLDPSLVCVSTRSVNDDIMPALLRTVREVCPNVPIICGGYGPTYAPEHYLRNGASIVVRGEGEIPFAHLLNNFRHKLALNAIPNACWMENGLMQSTAFAPPLKDISKLPSPLAGDNLVTFIETVVDKDGQESTSLAERDPAYDDSTFYCLIGRGCIGSCTYCAAPVLRNQYAAEGQIMPKYRRRSYAQVLDELAAAKAHGAKKIFFKDEYLVDAANRLEEFLFQYKERINLPFRGNFHPEQMLAHPSLLNTALDAGMYGFTIGFEAGTENVARNVYGRPHSFDNLKALAVILAEQFVALQYHFVSGTSLNTEEEFQGKCACIAEVPYDPLVPWRTMVMDFQFFPQPNSELTKKLSKGGLHRISVRQWAMQALRAQLRQVMSEEAACEVEIQAQREGDAVVWLQERLRESRAQKADLYMQNLQKKIIDKDVLIMGNDTDCKNFQAFECRIAARIVRPKDALERGTISVEQTVTAYGQEIPIILLGDVYFGDIPRLLRRKYHMVNPIYGAKLEK